MATAAVLASGSTVGEQSNEITLVAGTIKTYTLVGNGRVKLVFKNSAAALQDAGIYLDNGGVRAVNLNCNGVYRWERVCGTCGVDES